MQPMALAGIRVVDLTKWWSGPMAAQILGDFGAEVIKVESTVFFDPWRGGKAALNVDNYPDREPGAHPWNRSAYFNTHNRNKLGVTLDLAHPRGREALLRLIVVSDVVIENMSARVMPRLGLGYDTLRGVRPDLIMISMPASGMTGPERDLVGFGTSLEWLSGVTQLDGYEGGPPITNTGLAYGDPVGAFTAAYALLGALSHRLRTGKGVHIDLSQMEALTLLITEALMDYELNGRIQPRLGNRHPYMAPHGIYRCAGEDDWVAIAVENDAQWRSMCDALGQPGMAADPRFVGLPDRLRHRDDLDVLVTAWTSKRSHREAMATLQAAGVPAGAVLSARDLSEDPHLGEREYFETVAHPETGKHRYPGTMVRLSATPAQIRIPAPCLGQHSELVFRELLGMSDEEIAALVESGVTGTVPVL